MSIVENNNSEYRHLRLVTEGAEQEDVVSRILQAVSSENIEELKQVIADVKKENGVKHRQQIANALVGDKVIVEAVLDGKPEIINEIIQLVNNTLTIEEKRLHLHNIHEYNKQDDPSSCMAKNTLTMYDYAEKITPTKEELATLPPLVIPAGSVVDYLSARKERQKSESNTLDNGPRSL